MTNEEMRISIAEACGKLNDHTRQALYHFKDRDGYPDAILQLAIVPDYPMDLNAMNEAETRLTDDEYKSFHYHLTKLRNTQCEHPNICRCISAPARERATAYLQAINKWHD